MEKNLKLEWRFGKLLTTRKDFDTQINLRTDFDTQMKIRKDFDIQIEIGKGFDTPAVRGGCQFSRKFVSTYGLFLYGSADNLSSVLQKLHY